MSFFCGHCCDGLRSIAYPCRECGHAPRPKMVAGDLGCSEQTCQRGRGDPPMDCIWPDCGCGLYFTHETLAALADASSRDPARPTAPVLRSALERARRHLWDEMHSHMSEAEFNEEVDYIDQALRVSAEAGA